jgi:eukaryotic-like serine/threonine-protein kinase
MNGQPKHLYTFGPFRFDSEERLLVREGIPVPLAPKVVETLILLIRNAGHVVDKDDLMKRVWPDAFVEEGNLNKNIFILRKVLGQWNGGREYIETVPKRGFRFVATVNQVVEEEASSRPHTPAGAYLMGARVSHYRVLEMLGGGGMGVVYKAEDLKLGRRVALKFLPKELATDSVALERFRREAYAASALNHPNICTIHAIEDYEEQPFIVMELLEGETLRELVSASPASSQSTCQQKAPLQVDKLLDVAIQVIDGLDSAHRRGIIHRDIKPANIFVTIRGQAKILDFGLAQLGSDSAEAGLDLAGACGDSDEGRTRRVQALPTARSDPSLTRTGFAVGTAGYMSPEQVRCERLDARTDLFSFGMVLYEMATGQRPFTGDTAPVIREAILSQVPTAACKLNLDLPSELEQVISKCLEKDRKVRYQSASDVYADLQRIKRDIESRRMLAVVTNQNAATGLRLKGSSIALISTVVFLIALILAIFLFRRPSVLTERDTVVLGNFINTTGETVFDTSLKQALAVELGQSPFLNIFPDNGLRETLDYMGRSPDEPMTATIMREVCERRGIKAVVTGSISSLGRSYVIGLEARNCRTGDLLAQQQRQVQGKEQVLHGLDKAVSELRAQLGESLTSIQKFDFPIEQATTPSLEALQAYSLAQQQRDRGAEYEAIPFLHRAIELDPNFAMANGLLGTMYDHLGDDRAVEYLKKAFELRDRVSKPEKLYISSHYYEVVTHNLDQQIETYELWKRMYPRDPIPYVNLGSNYRDIGNYQQAAENARERTAFSTGHRLPLRDFGECIPWLKSRARR